MRADEAYQVTWFAMGTEWQLQLCSSKPVTYLRSVAEAVRAEVEQIEQLLSFYRETSDVCELNSAAGLSPIRTDPRLFQLVCHAQQLSIATGGAFDPTIGPLLRCWGFVGGSGAMPRPRDIEAATAVVGMQHVTLDATAGTVHFDRDGVELEFGAVGKGYAIERAVALLRDEFEIESALLHGGTSTIYGLGAPPGEGAWNVAIQRPYSAAGDAILTLPLNNRAVSVSAPHGKWFESDGRRYGHVLDPRTAYPAAGSVVAVVATESATDSDALSTALLVLGAGGIPIIRALRPDAFVLVGTHEEDGALQVIKEGPESANSGAPLSVETV